MTTICAVRDGKRTWIGSDTMGQTGGTRIDVGPKWVKSGGWAVGIAGNHRVQTLCESQSAVLFKNLESPFEFTGRFHTLLKEDGFDLSPTKDRANPNTGQDLLLATASGLWLIVADLSVTSVERWCEGSGHGYGLGAMFAMREIHEPERVLRAALAAAFESDAGTGGEIWTDVLE